MEITFLIQFIIEKYFEEKETCKSRVMCNIDYMGMGRSVFLHISFIDNNIFYTINPTTITMTINTTIITESCDEIWRKSVESVNISGNRANLNPRPVLDVKRDWI